jgi:hypothetical protein
MALLALVFGGLLIGVGVIGYTDPSKFGEYDKVSATSLIPAYFGAVLVLCGLIVIVKPGARKHAMHLAALTGLLGAAGGIMPLQRSGFNFSKASAVSGVLMTGLSILFVILCVRSFIRARQARKAAQPG